MTSFTWFGSLRDAVGQKPRKRMLARTRWPRHLSVEALEARHLPATFTVMNTFDSGPDSLRQAITDANNQANLGGPDIIRFEIPGAGVHRIWPTTILPQIKDPVVIDGYTQSGSSRNTSAMGDNAVLLIELDGGLGPSTASGLVITATASGSTVSGLIIGGFGARGDSNNGIDIQSSNNLITGNFIGTNAPNGGNGIKVEFGASNNTIGGDLASERNVISGNDGSGIEITGPSANNNVVAGNYIGTDASGIHLVRNKGAAGILLQDGASNNIIGGSDPASGNLISGNSNNGIEILGARTNPANHTMKNWVAGNLIGTDITGGSGLGNGGSGIYAHLETHGNLIGTNADGVNDDAERNIISGNGLEGVNIDHASNMVVAGNYVGTDITGTHRVANASHGIVIGAGSGNRIGTNSARRTDAAERNLISGNGSQGVWINNYDVNNPIGSTVAGNYIGLDRNGAALGNVNEGVLIQISPNNTIGGTAPGAGNTIAFNGAAGALNGAAGIRVLSGTSNQIRGNSIFSNAGVGIDLGNDGVTPNDSRGHSGPNNYQNFPSFEQATATINYQTSQTSITGGTLHSTPRATFTLDFYASANQDLSGYGEGQTYLGSAQVTTDATGSVSFDSATFATPLAAAPYGEDEITATATDANGNTSEFSADLLATVILIPASKTFLVTGFLSPITAGIPGSFTVTVLDDLGNVVTAYNGTVHFTSSDNQASVPADYTFTTADPGMHTFAAALETAGHQTLTATDTVSSSITGSAAITVNPAPASTLTVAGFASPVFSGRSSVFTITAIDPFGNVATGYRGTVQVTSTDPAAVLPRNYSFLARDAGVHTFRATLITTGAQDLGAMDAMTADITGAQTGIQVIPARFLVSGFPSPTTAGVSQMLTMTALDANGITATGYTGTVHFTSSDRQAGLPAEYLFTAADAGTHGFTATLKTAGTQVLRATDTVNARLTGAQTGIVVNPAAAATLRVRGFPAPTTAGVSQPFAVTARDPYGNTATGYIGTVHFTSSDRQAVLPADYTFTAADTGTHMFSAILETAGSQSLTATDTANGSITGTQSRIRVNAAAASTLVLTGFPSPTVAGINHGFTVTALDPYGNRATGYRATVQFSSADNQAVLPADYTFTATDGGRHIFGATLRTAGLWSIVAIDTATLSITGLQAGIQVNPSTASYLVVNAPGSVMAGVPFSFTSTAYDRYGNVATGYAGRVRFASSDTLATLPANYAFTIGDQGSHTFIATLQTSGTQSLTATDTSRSSITGTDSAILVTALDPASTAGVDVETWTTPDELRWGRPGIAEEQLVSEAASALNVSMLDRLFAQALVSGQHAATPAPLLLEDMSDDATPMCRVILGREARDVSWQDFADNGLGTALSIVILARLCSTGQCDSRKAKLADKEAHRPS